LSTAITSFTATHEIGHILDQLSGRTFRNSLLAQGVTNRTGFGLAESWSLSPNEVTADYFLNYVYSSFSNSALGTVLEGDWDTILSMAVNFQP
jgi:hypothetical protein